MIELPSQAIVLVCSTVSYNFHDDLPSRIAAAGRPDVRVIDCPVYGSINGAVETTFTLVASGPQDAMTPSDLLLRSMSEKLHIIPSGAGAATKVIMINQLLVGIHVVAAAEAMAMAAKAGLNTREVYDIIANAAGSSWVFENRVPRMLDGDWTACHTLDSLLVNFVRHSTRSLSPSLSDLSFLLLGNYHFNSACYSIPPSHSLYC